MRPKHVWLFPYPNDQTVHFEIVVTTSRPYSIAFDLGNSHLYWAENNFLGRILRCDSDGSSITTIVNVHSPFALSLDTQNRWIYYSEGYALHRVTLNGIEKQVVVNLTARPIGIDMDFVDKRVYWMEYETGDLKSALYNGSDVKTVIITNVSSSSHAIDIVGDYVFCASNYKILKVHKSSGQISAIVHKETLPIYGLLFYKQEEPKQHTYYLQNEVQILNDKLQETIGFVLFLRYPSCESFF